MIIDIEENKMIYKSYLSGFKGGKRLFKYMEANGFFQAPCSAGHHLNCDGGLATHCISVLSYGLDVLRTYAIPIKETSLIKCALLHDIFKMFLYEKKEGKWQYKKQDLADIHYKQHGQWAVEIIQSFIKLTKQEKEMILWHMGPYTEYYDHHKSGDFLKWSADKKNSNINAALFLYFCDHFSSMFLED